MHIPPIIVRNHWKCVTSCIFVRSVPHVARIRRTTTVPINFRQGAKRSGPMAGTGLGGAQRKERSPPARRFKQDRGTCPAKPRTEALRDQPDAEGRSAGKWVYGSTGRRAAVVARSAGMIAHRGAARIGNDAPFIVVLDNLAAHKVQGVRQCLEAAGMGLL